MFASLSGIRRDPLALRLIIWTVIFGSVFSLIASTVQLYVRYQSDIDLLKENFEVVETSHKASLENALWVFNEDQVDVILGGLLEQTDIAFLTLVTPEGRQEHGDFSEEAEALERTFELEHVETNGSKTALGTLTVGLTKKNVHQQLYQSIGIILLTNGFKTLAISLFMFIAFYFLVAKHLQRISAFLREFDEKNPSGPLVLDRDNETRTRDDLQEVTDAINRIIKNLGQSDGARRANEERLELSLRAGKFGTWSWNIKTGLVEWDDREHEIFGISKEDFNGRYEDWTGKVHPDDLPGAQAGVEEALRKNEGEFTGAYRIEDGRGGWKYLRNLGIVLRGEDGEPEKMFGVTIDETKTQRAVKALKTSEERFRLVGELATDGYWDWDLKTNDEYLSPSFKRLFGYEDHELPNRAESWQKIIHPDDLQLALKAFEAHTQKGEPFHVPVRYKHKQGYWVWVICRGVALKNVQGEYYRMLGTHTDITELKKAEEQIKEYAEQLKETNRELEQFAYVASHDLQEPLRTISGYVSLIEKRYQDKLDDPGKEFMGFIVDAAERMKLLISDLLTYSRSAQVEIEVVPVSLDEVLGEVRKNLKFKIEETGAEIISDSLPTVKGSASLLGQLLQNLIENAIKFTKKDKTPRIQIKVEEEPDAEFVRISVQDNGIGIKEKYFERMFVIFQRLNKRNEYPGTGIGLSLCKKIVERHGGQIWVESEVDKGTTFYFTLRKDAA